MAAYFFDSSAIAKRYHWEPGSTWVRAVCSPRQQHRLYLSRLAHVEVVAGLRRTGRIEDMHPAAIDALVNTFERQLALSTPDRPMSIYHLLPVSDAVLRLAAALCNVYAGRAAHPLRSLDAIQLASAITEASTLADELVFVTADTHLATVAEDEGFRVINPAFPPSP